MRLTTLTTLITGLSLSGLLFVEPAQAGPSDGMVVGITKIVDNGPASSRFNLVLMGDGYQQGELAQFAQDCQDFVEFMFQTPPFDENCSINVYRIDVTSTDSGADDPDTCDDGTGATADTYFDSTFCSDGVIRRLLGANNSTATDVLNAQLPEWNQALVIVNTSIYGGSGGTVGVTSVSGTWENIAIHEFGHSAFGLADEYEYWSGCGSGEAGHDNHPASEPSQPNVTIESDRNLIKWASFIDAATAMPTTENADCTMCDPQGDPFPGMQVVGAYEGAHYYHCDAYRPVFSCMMRNFAPFCPVCTARINQTLAPYAPEDTTTPPSITSFAVSGTDVDANCVGSITFFAGVSDTNYLPESGIEVTVSNPTNNATVSNVMYTVTPNGTNAFTISGSATVSNLTSCPATILVTIEATDGCGNTSMEDASANVHDRITPQVVALDSTGGEVDDNCDYVLPFSGAVTDNCCVRPEDVDVAVNVITNNATLGMVALNKSQAGATRVNFNGQVVVSDLTSCPATVRVSASTLDCCDNMSNISSVDADVVDATPPMVECPDDLVLGRGTTAICPMTPNEWLASFKATDNCDGMPTLSNNSVEQGAPCGGFPCDGTTTVTFTAEDDCGNQNSCEAKITVIPDHPGWNNYDAKITLTGNQPAYWSAASGDPLGIPPFDSLDPGCLPGRKDPEGSGDRLMRGYVLAWAVNQNGEEIRWNHLAGDALILEYRRATAAEYDAYAFQALVGENGVATGTPGQLHLDGVEYQTGFAELLFNFFATGAQINSAGPLSILTDTDLTLFPVSVDLRQENNGPVTTKANFTIWNMNEFKFSGTERCITCWDQALLRGYDAPNHFLRGNLQTDMGKARVDGLASQNCDLPDSDSQAASLLGLSIKQLRFGKALKYTAGLLTGVGNETALIQADLAGGIPPERPALGLGLDRLGGDRGTGRTVDADGSPLAGGPGAVELGRVSGSTKGSLLILSKIELRWTADGDYLVQDTFLDLINDFPAEVDVQMYFINGDPPIEP
ncbi:MAG: HYR domain-containing protein [Phycisphaerae bacterium]|nr:HYR domain-containing protein [Phycisphaerae bacterium]